MLSAFLSAKRSSRRGFILVSVLLLAVVFISCVTAFAWFTRLQIKSVMREKASLESRSMAHVLTLSIMSKLKELGKKSNYDSLTQLWYKPFPLDMEDLGTWIVQLTPLDDKIPIRNVFLPDGNTLRTELRKPWEDLWYKLGHPELANLVLDFMDKDKKARMGSTHRESFINRYPIDMSEFLLIEEMKPEFLYGSEGIPGFANYSTIWSDGKINLNMAPVHVLEILPGLDSTIARKIASERENSPLKGTTDLKKISGFPPKALGMMTNLIGFSSRFVEIRLELLENKGGVTLFKIIIDKSVGRIVRWEEI